MRSYNYFRAEKKGTDCRYSDITSFPIMYINKQCKNSKSYSFSQTSLYGIVEEKTVSSNNITCIIRNASQINKYLMPAYVLCNSSQSVNKYLSYSLPGLISIDILRQNSAEWKLALEVIYMLVATLQFVLSVILNLIMIETLLQKKIRITTCGIYLLLFSFTSLIEMPIFYLRIVVTLYFNEQLDKNSLLHCRLSAAALDWSFFVSLWSCSFVAVERVLIQCFKFSIYRSRKYSLVISLLLIIVTATAASATWFLNSQSTIHPILPTMYLCKMPLKLQPTWKLVHQIITSVYIHLVIPWMFYHLRAF
jgi:hypothetical protein